MLRTFPAKLSDASLVTVSSVSLLASMDVALIYPLAASSGSFGYAYSCFVASDSDPPPTLRRSIRVATPTLSEGMPANVRSRPTPDVQQWSPALSSSDGQQGSCDLLYCSELCVCPSRSLPSCCSLISQPHRLLVHGGSGSSSHRPISWFRCASSAVDLIGEFALLDLRPTSGNVYMETAPSTRRLPLTVQRPRVS